MAAACPPKAVTSAHMRGTAASTAATAPRKRTNSMSCAGWVWVSLTQQLAFKGRGCAPQRCSKAKASACGKWQASVTSAGAWGSTLSDTSVITPKVPMLPANTRDTS